jgi:rod shape determining protein RodA
MARNMSGFHIQHLKKINIGIVLLICFIAGIGFAMLYSAANGSFSPWAYKQMIRFVVGLVIMLLVAITDIRVWMSLAYPMYLGSLILLIGVEAMGFIGMGAQRWIDLYVIQLQPSEVMKIALVLALARYFQACTMEEIGKMRTLFVPLILIFIPTLLVMRQPDLGTALILVMSGAILFFATGVKIWKFVVGIVGGLGAIPILWNFLHDYQKKRVLIFLNPESDSANAGYHITQSKIALGSGGFFGKGFLQGTQSHLNFLPEKQTDFIFTMFNEEFGFVGALFLLLCYVVLLGYGYKIALASRNHFGRLVALGMNSIVFLYLFVNTAMVMGLLPVVGVPLPFVSYGGTAMLTLLMGQGLIFSVATYYDVRIGR